jgi:hypothetical protein
MRGKYEDKVVGASMRGECEDEVVGASMRSKYEGQAEQRGGHCRCQRYAK